MLDLSMALKSLQQAGYSIDGIRVGQDGSVTASSSTGQLTEEAQAAAAATVASLKSRQESYEAAIAAGYLVEPEGFTLAIGDADLIEWTKLTNLTREALDLGQITNDTEQVILDKNFVPHVVTTLRLRQILVGLGLYYKQVWTTYRS